MRLHTSILAVLLLAIAALAAVSLAPDMPVNASLHGLASTLIKTHTPTSTPLPEATATATATHTATPEPTATATPSATVTPSATPTQAPVSSRAIFVDQDAQVMHVYENGVEVKTIPCSTGTGEPGESTPPWSGRVGHYVGTFFAFGSFADDAWFLFKSAGDILIHSAPYVWEDGKKVYQDMDALGTRPASHGCIRLAPEDARWLTRWNPRGVPITISARTKGPS